MINRRNSTVFISATVFALVLSFFVSETAHAYRADAFLQRLEEILNVPRARTTVNKRQPSYRSQRNRAGRTISTPTRYMNTYVKPFGNEGSTVSENKDAQPVETPATRRRSEMRWLGNRTDQLWAICRDKFSGAEIVYCFQRNGRLMRDRTISITSRNVY